MSEHRWLESADGTKRLQVLIRNLAATGQIYSFPRRQRPLTGGYKRKSVYAGPSLCYATLCALAAILGAVVWGVV